MVTSDFNYHCPEKDIDENKFKFIRLSSPDNSANQLVAILIDYFGKHRSKIIKYSSFSEDLISLHEMCLDESIKFYPGKTKFKIFTVSYPEIHAEIRETSVIDVLNVWTSTNYQTQAVYIVDSNAKNKLFRILEQDIYKETYSLEKVCDFVEMVIMNEPNAVWHNTFVLAVSPNHHSTICKIISNSGV